MEKTIEYKNHIIKISVTLNGHKRTKENINGGRFDNPYITEVNHLFECYIDDIKLSESAGNDYDLCMQITEDKLIKECKDRIDIGFDKKVDNINILKNLGYK